MLGYEPDACRPYEFPKADEAHDVDNFGLVSVTVEPTSHNSSHEALRRPIYLDHHATTPVDPRVAQVVADAINETFGNAASVEHAFGMEAANLIESAAAAVAKLVGAEDARDVLFTAGASEALRTAVSIAALTRADAPMRVLLPATEHTALLDAVARMQRQARASIRWLGVDGMGRVDLDEIAAAPFDLVCLMAANNEIGTIHPVRAAAAIARRNGAAILVDATQGAGRIEVKAAEWGLDLVVFSAHKIHGPKGSGAVVGPGVAAAVASGALGHHGTPNVPAIAGFGEACRLQFSEGSADAVRIGALRDRLEHSLRDRIHGLVVNGDLNARLSHNLHVSIPGVPNDAVLARLRHTVAVSTGSACQSGAQGPSHVLRAIALPAAHQESALRMSPGRFTTAADIDAAADAIVAAVGAIRALAGPDPCRR